MANNYVKVNLRDTFKYLDYDIQALGYGYGFPEVDGKNVSNDFWKWRRLDNRFTDLFGSTYEVPLSDYKQVDDVVRVLISGDKLLQCSSTKLNIYHITDTEDVCEATGKISEVYIDDLDTMDTLIYKAYPNANVELLGEFNKESAYKADIISLLANLKDKIENSEELPTHIIFSGLENTYKTYGYALTYETLSDILEICNNNDIKYVCVLSEFPELSNESEMNYDDIYDADFLHLLNMLSHSYVVNVCKWLYSRDSEYNVYDSNYGIHMDITYNYIYDSCFKAVYLDVFRYSYYVSFVNLNITGKPYDSFFGDIYLMPPHYDPDRIHFVSVPYSKIAYLYDVTSKYATMHYKAKYGSEYSLNTFKNNGELVAICLHTKYDSNLFASEQFQSNCNDIFVNQIDTVTTPLQNLLPMRKWQTGYDPIARRDISCELGSVRPPAFPMAGCPWLTISKENVNDYKNQAIEPYTPIGVWLTRDNSSMTITTNLRPSNIDKLNLFQSIAFGGLSVLPINHVQHLYCGGGSGGLCQDIMVFKDANPESHRFLHYEGNVYDLSMDNVTMSNSNILHPTKFNGSSISNFRVLTSEGTWRDIFSEKQDAVVVSMPTDGIAPVSQFGYVLGPVNHDFGVSGHSIYPRMSDDCHKISGKYINKHGHTNIEGVDELDRKPFDFSSHLQSIDIVLDSSLPHGESNNSGAIPHCFASWDDNLPVGELELGGKKYLSVPCGWEGRLYDYRPRTGPINSVWQSDVVVNDWESLTRQTRDNVIDDRLIIELG